MKRKVDTCAYEYIENDIFLKNAAVPQDRIDKLKDSLVLTFEKAYVNCL